MAGRHSEYGQVEICCILENLFQKWILWATVQKSNSDIVIPLCLLINVCNYEYCQSERKFYNTALSVVVCTWFGRFSAIDRSSSRWRYSPGWALASATICLQASRFLALSLHSFIPIFLRSMNTSSSHLILGLPLRLVAYSFPYSILFGISVSCILSIWPSHLILWRLINLTMFSPLIMASNSSFCRILHNSFSLTVPYTFRKIFLSNTDNALSSSMVSVHDSEP